MRNRTSGGQEQPAILLWAELVADPDGAVARVEAGETLIIERDGKLVVRMEPPSEAVE